MPYGTWLTIYDVNILFYGCITMYSLIAWWFLSRKRGEEKNVRPSHVADKWVALGPVYLPCNMQIEHNFICNLCKANGLAYRSTHTHTQRERSKITYWQLQFKSKFKYHLTHSGHARMHTASASTYHSNCISHVTCNLILQSMGVDWQLANFHVHM